MAHSISVPFYAFKVHFLNGATFSIPLNDREAVRLGQPLYLIAGKYAELLQRKVLDKGELNLLMEEYIAGDFLKASITVKFAASKDKVSFPKFSLEFEYFFHQQESGIWGIIPVLDIEAYGSDLEELEKRLKEAIQLDFARKKRFSDVRLILNSIWEESVELLQHEMELQVPNPKELEKAEQSAPEQLLPLVASKLQFPKQVIYGRKEEMDHFSRALKGKFHRNVLLVGSSGVGKTALVWEMSRQLKRRKIERQLWETTASLMIKELMRETGWQDNLSFLCRELKESGDILFIRNLMELFEVGQYEGNSVSLADYLRPYLSRGELILVSECTEEELAKIEVRASNYLSFFQLIRIQEPSKKLEEIILNKVQDIASIKNIFIKEEAIKETIRLNKRFTPYSGMPGKPIRFLESIILNKKNENTEKNDKGLLISRSEVIRSFAEETGMPLFMIDPTIPMNTTQIKADFNTQIYGQEDAVEQVIDILASVKTALSRTGKPIASFLFVGPTGVGKTELAKILASFMFGSRDRMIRFDMSEFSNPVDVLRLIGTGYYSDGLLTSAVRREPFCVLLFDEIEKADPTFNDLLLQILSEGRLTDAQGKLVNFCSTIIIMTSNIGASKMQNQGIRIHKEEANQDVLNYFMNAVQQHFRPELYNRIDRIVPFLPLDPLTVRFVVEREIELFRQREGIQFRRMQLDIEEEVLDYLAKAGYSNKYGARQLQRTIREELITPLATQLNYQDFDDQLSVSIKVQDENIQVEIEADPLGIDLLFEELEKYAQTNYTSFLRRQINRIKEGGFYIQLLSELDQLEIRKKRLKNKFWQDRNQGERYTYYLQTKTKVEELSQDIELLEEELSLACLNLGSYRLETAEKVKQWEDAFFELKLELYTRLFPKTNTCHFGVYGRSLEGIYSFYLQLFKYKAYDFILEAVWFRERHYNEQIIDEDGKTVKREEYIKTMISSDALYQPFKPEHKDDLFCGLEFTITGNCAYLYLKEEYGGQKWKQDEKNQQICDVLVNNSVFKTPTLIHRKDYYNKLNCRRTIELNTVKDNRLSINREFRKNQLVEIISERMDDVFKEALDKELF